MSCALKWRPLAALASFKMYVKCFCSKPLDSISLYSPPLCLSIAGALLELLGRSGNATKKDNDGRYVHVSKKRSSRDLLFSIEEGSLAGLGVGGARGTGINFNAAWYFFVPLFFF